ncbi:phosphate metabolism protein 7 [Elasticomyces elasticus]|nr:phosphate metabolism protein 7 [Elasticomyces elasticus]KAK4980494.1 phosphate metabolism protein 7 [Elasticomyces elasticus]
MSTSSETWIMETFNPASTRTLVPRAAASQTGTHRQQGSSLSALLSTLIPIFVIASIAFLLFCLFQKKFDRVYGPRTYLGVLDKSERSPKQTAGFLGWTKEFRQVSDEYVLGHSSLDNYLFLRLFKILMVISFAGCIITWPVLFPVNATGGGGETGLDILSFSNVSNPVRYYAHCIMAWIFLGFVMFVISRESLYFAYLRQAYFLSPWVTSQISSKTVLFVDVPEEYQNEKHLRQNFQDVRHIWLVKDPEDLEDLVEERDEAADKLETAEVKMIMQYVKTRNKKGDRGVPEEDRHQNGHAAGIYIDPKDRPTHRTKPLIGKKVDTIQWGREELHHLIPEVAKQQSEQRHGKGKTTSAVFIEFTSVRAAQAAFQQVAHQTPYHMTPKEIGMKPDMVLWKNLGKPWWQVKIFSALSTAFVAFLCIFWTIPVAFIGVLTNVNYLTNEISWLSFLNSVPSQIMGIITGLLPALLLAVLMALVPIICAMLAKQFEPTLGAVQLKVQSWYFAFQVIQVFLVTTFTSGAASVVTQIVQNPVQAPQLLAKNIPKASNFYISYFVVFGLAQAALQLLNLVPLLFVMVLGRLMDKTPRKMYNRYVSLAGIGWGSFYPKYTNLGVIALAYSCIAPLVLGFATVGFALLYLAFRYNILFTMGTDVDTKGRAYARALQQLTVGIYLAEFCLIGLFAIGTSGSAASAGPLVLMIIFTIGTILWHVQLRAAVAKHVVSLPSDLLAEQDNGPQHNRDEEKGYNNGHATKKVDSDSSASDEYQVPNSANPPKPPTGIVGRLKGFLLPGRFASAAVISKHILSPHLANPVRPYTPKEREEAYMHPALTAETPIIWLPRDDFGLSKQETHACEREVGEGVEVSDKNAWVDESGKVQWDERELKKAPLYEDEVQY